VLLEVISWSISSLAGLPALPLFQSFVLILGKRLSMASPNFLKNNSESGNPFASNATESRSPSFSRNFLTVRMAQWELPPYLLDQ
jgi:hypothetical protein